MNELVIKVEPYKNIFKFLFRVECNVTGYVINKLISKYIIDSNKQELESLKNDLKHWLPNTTIKFDLPTLEINYNINFLNNTNKFNKSNWPEKLHICYNMWNNSNDNISFIEFIDKYFDSLYDKIEFYTTFSYSIYTFRINNRTAKHNQANDEFLDLLYKDLMSCAVKFDKSDLQDIQKILLKFKVEQIFIRDPICNSMLYICSDKIEQLLKPRGCPINIIYIDEFPFHDIKTNSSITESKDGYYMSGVAYEMIGTKSDGTVSICKKATKKQLLEDIEESKTKDEDEFGGIESKNKRKQMLIDSKILDENGFYHKDYFSKETREKDVEEMLDKNRPSFRDLANINHLYGKNDLQSQYNLSKVTFEFRTYPNYKNNYIQVDINCLLFKNKTIFDIDGKSGDIYTSRTVDNLKELYPNSALQMSFEQKIDKLEYDFMKGDIELFKYNSRLNDIKDWLEFNINHDLKINYPNVELLPIKIENLNIQK